MTINDQYLIVPEACRKATRLYMRRRKIKFTPYYTKGELLFKISKKYRPHSWKIGCPCDLREWYEDKN